MTPYKQLPQIIITGLFLATLALAIIVQPSYSPVPHLGIYDSKRAVLIILQTLAVFYLIINCFYGKNPCAWRIKTTHLYWLASVLLFILISTIASSSVNNALIEILNIAGLTLIAGCIADISSKFPAVRLTQSLVIVFSISIGIYLFVFLVGYFAAINTQSSIEKFVLLHGFSNYRFFNQAQAWIIPILAIPLITNVFTTQKHRYYWVFWSLLCLNVTLLVFFSARGTSLSLLISTVIILMATKDIAKPLILRLTILIAVALAIYWLLFVTIPGLTGFSITDTVNIRVSSSGRWELWLICLDIIKNNPLFGIGPMGLAGVSNSLSISHPHNSVLQLAAEWGIPATGIIVFCYFYMLMTIWRSSQDKSVSQERRVYRLSLTWALLSGSIYSLFSGVIVMPMSQLLGVTIIGLIISECFPKVQVSHTSNRKVINNAAVITFTSLFLISYLSLVWPQFTERMKGTQSYTQNLVNIGPRYWQEGGLKANN